MTSWSYRIRGLRILWQQYEEMGSKTLQISWRHLRKTFNILFNFRVLKVEIFFRVIFWYSSHLFKLNSIHQFQFLIPITSASQRVQVMFFCKENSIHQHVTLFGNKFSKEKQLQKKISFTSNAFSVIFIHCSLEENFS